MNFSELSSRAKLNYIFFWINLIVAFILASTGSFLSVFSVIVSFFCWCTYKYQDDFDKKTKIKKLDDF